MAVRRPCSMSWDPRSDRAHRHFACNSACRGFQEDDVAVSQAGWEAMGDVPDQGSLWSRLSRPGNFLVGVAGVLSCLFAYLALQRQGSETMTSRPPTGADEITANSVVPDPETSTRGPLPDPSPTGSDQTGVTAPPVAPDVAAEKANEPSEDPSDQERERLERQVVPEAAPAPPPPLPAIDLAGRICQNQVITINTNIVAGDNRRYTVLAGGRAIPIKCDSERTFTIEPDASVSSTPSRGTIGANSLSFQFKYYSLQRMITCTVNASRIVSFSFEGRISCTGSNNELESRPAQIDV